MKDNFPDLTKLVMKTLGESTVEDFHNKMKSDLGHSDYQDALQLAGDRHGVDDEMIANDPRRARGHIMNCHQALCQEQTLEGIASKIIQESKPSAGLSHNEKSHIEHEAHNGEHVFGGHFDEVQKKVEAEGYSKHAAEKIAAAAMWKKAAE